MSTKQAITTVNQASETIAERSVEPAMEKLDKQRFPLTRILTASEARRAEAGNQKVEHFEDAPLNRFDSLAADLTAGAASMTVADYTKFVKNMLVRVNKGEIVRVTTTPTTAVVAISRAVGETAAAAASNGNQLQIVCMAYEEGAAKGTALMSVPVAQYNYMQIFRNLVKWTGSAAASDRVVKTKTKDEERADQILEHFKDIELACILGERSSQTGPDGGQLRTMRGLLAWIQTNVTDFGADGVVTEEEWEEHVRVISRFSENLMLGFYSSKLVSILNGFGREKLNVVDPKGRYGVSFSGYRHGGKEIDFLSHPLLENESQTDLTGLAGTGITVDPSDLKMRYLPGRYMVHRYNNGHDLNDYDEEEILSECCVTIVLEKKHGKCTGAQS